jgi:predicted nucleic acid-binding protein
MKKYLLDTNAFWEILHTWNHNAILSPQLPQDLWQENRYVFCISEITAMEIYSVIGKELRGKPAQEQVCKRQIERNKDNLCNTVYYEAAQRRLSREIGRDIFHLIRAILLGEEDSFQVETVAINTEIVRQSAVLLELYAEKRDFHSLDALIAGTTKVCGVTVISADKKLCNILELADIAHIRFQPSIPHHRTASHKT